MKGVPKKILFVCRHNRFRSKFAESYFNKINKNKLIKVKSAGIFPGNKILNPIEVKISKEFGAEIKGKPQPITTDLLKWNDLIILITDDVPNPKGLFNYASFRNKVIVWKIKDSNWISKTQMRGALKKIKKKIDQLNKEIEKNGNNKSEIKDI